MKRNILLGLVFAAGCIGSAFVLHNWSKQSTLEQEKKLIEKMIGDSSVQFGSLEVQRIALKYNVVRGTVKDREALDELKNRLSEAGIMHTVLLVRLMDKVDNDGASKLLDLKVNRGK